MQYNNNNIHRMGKVGLKQVHFICLFIICCVELRVNCKPLPAAAIKDTVQDKISAHNNETNIPIPVPKDPPIPAEQVETAGKNDKLSKDPSQLDIPHPGDERDQPPEDAGAGHGINDREAQIQDLPQKNVMRVSPQDQSLKLRSEEKLKVEDLKPPDHLDAVKMEQDGHLNKDYLKEIFVGNHEDLEKGTNADQEKNLADIFHKVDVNSDGALVVTELEDWIQQKIQEHFDEAVEENEKVFAALDSDKDSYVSWKEFCKHFLIAKGHDPKDAEDDPEVIIMNLGDKENDNFHKFKYHWEEADRQPEDGKLSMEEFLAFRHPEQSQAMMDSMVKDIMESLDKDQDRILTEEEFIALPPGEVDEDGQASDKRWQEERRKEFRNDIDVNHDGKATRDELQKYLDPRNPNVAKVEAKNLLAMADDNQDGKLSLEEVLLNKNIFLESKVVNTGWSFHSEL